MTDAELMDAHCIHGEVWHECEQCADEMNRAIELEARHRIIDSLQDPSDRAAIEAIFRRVDWRRDHER